MNHWKSSVYRSLCLFALIGTVAASSAWAQTAELAPLSPAFEAWRDGRVPEAKAEGHALGYVPVPWQKIRVAEPAGAGAKALPTSYDLRGLGEVTPVQNQGNCGSCWSFSSYAAVEGWLLKNLDETWNFSENHLKNYNLYDYGPCGGGNEHVACSYFARGAGPVLEDDDPYSPSDDRPSPGGPKQKQIQSMLRFPTAASIKEAVMTYGALATTMYMDESYYNPSDYTYYCTASIGVPNHGVAIVGWDDAKVVTGGPQANPAPGAWIVKNSWGTWWGQSGYFYISYYDTDAVVNADGAYAFTMAEPTAYARIYQHDPLGMCGATGYNSDTPQTCWGANVFMGATDETLDAVAFYTCGPNTTYTVYIYDTIGSLQFSSLLASKSGSFVEEGYHILPLDTPVTIRQADQFAIMLRLTTPGNDRPMPVEYNLAGYSSQAVVNPGESYMSWDGATWQNSNYNICVKGLKYGTLAGIGSISVADSVLPADDLEMAFGTAKEGTVHTEQITIQNTDAFSPLTITTLGIMAKSGGSESPEKIVYGGFSLANVPTLPAIVAANSSLTIDVRFAPQGGGVFADTILIESNDEDTPSVSIQLSGEATPGGLPAAGPVALVILAGAMAAAAAIKNRRRR